ncbi:MAG: CRISPR-associated endonuclease Cas1 [Bacteroidota bacterium]
MQLVLDTKGLKIQKKNGTFLVISEKGERSISPAKLSSIAITATVELSTDAILLAVDNQLPIIFFNRIGKPQARLWSPYFSSISTLRRQQILFAEIPEATSWMVSLFEIKTEQQLQTIKYLKQKNGRLNIALTTASNGIKRNGRNLDNYRGMILDKARPSLLGVEGSIARIYWQAVGNGIPRVYGFSERSRRPAKDIFNAALNYLYGMLYSVVEGAIFAVGLDPHLGIFHVDAHDKPTLSFDLIEPFRPWVDLLLVKQCYEGTLKKSQFTQNRYGIFLNKEGKAHFIPVFNDFMRSKLIFLDQEASVKNHIHYLAGQLAQRIRSSF